MAIKHIARAVERRLRSVAAMVTVRIDRLRRTLKLGS
jgi:hypothetical protein